MLNKKKILIVEDEEPMRLALREALEDWGYTCIEAENGAEGYNKAMMQLPDVIIADLIMPVLNGDQMLDKIRNEAWGATIPVIVLTNIDPDDKTLAKIVTYKPAYYLIKSNVALNDIANKVKELLK